MHPDQLAALDNDRELTRAFMAALPVPVRAALEPLRLAYMVGMGLRVIASTRHAEALEEYAAETRAYVTAGWFYDEITEDQKRVLFDHIREQASARREQLTAQGV
jgi:hypothetical protein